MYNTLINYYRNGIFQYKDYMSIENLSYKKIKKI